MLNMPWFSLYTRLTYPSHFISHKEHVAFVRGSLHLFVGGGTDDVAVSVTLSMTGKTNILGPILQFTIGINVALMCL